MKNSANVLKLQFLVVSVIFVVIIISLVLLYNEILKAEGYEGFIENDDVLKLNILIRTVYFISALFFLYVVLSNYDNENNNTNIELLISIASLFATSLSLYLAYTTYKSNNESIFENEVVF